MISIYVDKDYDDYVKKTFAQKEQLRRFFLNHERKELFCRNVTKELIQCEFKGVLYTRKQIQKLVYDMMKMYCINCLNHEEKKRKSAFQELVDEHGNKIKKDDKGMPEMPEGVIPINRNDTPDQIKRKVDGK